MKNDNNKLKIVLGILITIVALGFSLFVILNGNKESEITIDEANNTVNVGGGLYSKTIEIDQTSAVNIISPIEIIRRTNGSSVGNVKKGYFTLVDDRAVYLSLGDNTIDWIEIINGEDYYYLNLRNDVDTLDLYHNILALIE